MVLQIPSHLVPVYSHSLVYLPSINVLRFTDSIGQIFDQQYTNFGTIDDWIYPGYTLERYMALYTGQRI